jgi:hypothetical protein
MRGWMMILCHTRCLTASVSLECNYVGMQSIINCQINYFIVIYYKINQNVRRSQICPQGSSQISSQGSSQVCS